MAEEVIRDVGYEEVSGARPSTDANMVIQLLAGVIGTFVIYFAVQPLKDMAPGIAYIYSIIRQRGPVQYVELFMASMVLALIVLKARIVREQLRAVAEGPVNPDIDLANDDEIMELRKKVRSEDTFHSSILLSRIDRMLALWLGSKDIGRVATWASAESDRDMTASDSSYSIGRVLIWAIPILGFIGTVVGLGNAVSGFAEFLAGAAELSQIKDAIGGVTIGLGVAFDTTLLALILSVILMFPLSIIQRREENLFVEIDSYLDDTLMSRFPSPEQQPIVIENLEDSIEAAFRRYIPDPDRYEEVFTNSIEKASAAVEERFSGLARNYEATLNDLTARLSSSMATVGDSLEASMRKIVDDVKVQDESILARRKDLSEAEAQQFKALGDDLYNASRKVADEYKQSAESIQSATREAAQQSLGAAQELSAKMQDVIKLAATIEDLLKIQEAVRQGMEGIASSDEFAKTLQDLRGHLATTDAFCKQLSKPRTITLREEPA